MENIVAHDYTQHALAKILLVEDFDDTRLMMKMWLEKRGYRVVVIPLGSFLRSGGAAFCLTLRLDGRSARNPLAADAEVAA